MRSGPDMTSLIGIIATVGAVFLGISIEAHSISDLLVFFWGKGVWAAWFVVIGGTIMATFTAFTWGQISAVLKIMRSFFTTKKYNNVEIIEKFVEYGRRLRREGVKAIEQVLDEVEHPYMRRGLRAIADGLDTEAVERILDAELDVLQERHTIGQKIFDFAAMCAPSFGLIGAVSGLIRTLINLEDPSKVGPGVALAFVSTFYGILLAYGIFTPIKGKLEMKHSEEMITLMLIREGVLALSKGDPHIVIEEKLKGYVTGKEREVVEQRGAA
ncbi:Chemotaxis protein PomA [bacterium HR19]|nr:Chemotaxis protein PomA [bacterium HR19]